MGFDRKQSMLELVVIGPKSGQCWRRALPAAGTVRIGRSVEAGWSVPWDRMISREHADLCVKGDSVEVMCLERALNAAEYKGESHRVLRIGPGESFVIGQTCFQIDHDEPPTMAGTAVQEHRYARATLRGQEFRDAEARLQVLTDLPSVVSRSVHDEEFAQAMSQLLLAGISRSNAAAVLHCASSDLLNVHAPTTMRWSMRDGQAGGFHPSRRLIHAALERGESILHVWSEEAKGGGAFTMTGSCDWAFCTPVVGPASAGWCFYVTGRRSSTINSAEDLCGDVRFAELLAEVTAVIRDVKLLERRQAGMSQFFSPAIVEMMTQAADADPLAPRECDITVMFCDMRGFSRMSEEGRHDLRGLLECSSQALGVMTEAVFAEGGVIADFQGDAVLGFWGWPIAQADARDGALRAALRIQRAFADARGQDGHALSGMGIGIGITHGRAIAGRIGTRDQSKVGVFGPVVNLGARLESLTKHFGTTILTDAETAARLLSPERTPDADADAPPRIRRLARVQPAGMTQIVDLCEVCADTATSARAEPDAYEIAREAFERGAWDEARAALAGCAEDDGPRAFLDGWMRRFAEPPADWSGVIIMHDK
ncbi:MAG: adenylate/guanylate cyclase domain-containing protein [Phycisphaerales bacterium]|nr:adenylate/guanylate cyclase domain-containing protein [Phycisphaerales bacterium]